MSELKPQIPEDANPRVSNKKRSIALVTLCFFLVLSLAGNAFLGLSLYNYTAAYKGLNDTLTSTKITLQSNIPRS